MLDEIRGLSLLYSVDIARLFALAFLVEYYTMRFECFHLINEKTLACATVELRNCTKYLDYTQ